MPLDCFAFNAVQTMIQAGLHQKWTSRKHGSKLYVAGRNVMHICYLPLWSGSALLCPGVPHSCKQRTHALDMPLACCCITLMRVTHIWVTCDLPAAASCSCVPDPALQNIISDHHARASSAHTRDMRLAYCCIMLMRARPCLAEHHP